MWGIEATVKNIIYPWFLQDSNVYYISHDELILW